MNIIDKNTDYYDYYQKIYKDDTLTFDRRDSYILSKEGFANCFYFRRGYFKENRTYVLLQVGFSNWLFELNATKLDSFDKCVDYDLNLLSNWKDYRKKELIKLSHIDFKWWLYHNRNTDDLVAAIKNNEYDTIKVFNKFTYYAGDYKYKQTKTIPILKNIGIPNLVAPLDIYLALEEYFSHEKTRAEKTEPNGASNDDKITAHGFDTKKSFRKR